MGFLYFVVFFQEQNNLSLNLTRTSLNLPNGKFLKKLCFDFWFSISILGISEQNYLSLKLVFYF